MYGVPMLRAFAAVGLEGPNMTAVSPPVPACAALKGVLVDELSTSEGVSSIGRRLTNSTLYQAWMVMPVGLGSTASSLSSPVILMTSDIWGGFRRKNVEIGVMKWISASCNHVSLPRLDSLPFEEDLGPRGARVQGEDSGEVEGA
jgi:hypothetical protein